MAIVLKDRVKQTAAAPGTGTITLSGSVLGFQAFSAIGNGNVTYFAISDPVSGAWEVNYGTYTSSGTTLSRNATPLSSSAAGALVNFTGAVDVFCTYPSSKAIYEETTGNVLVDGGPLTVVGSGVTSYTTFGAALAELYANVNSFAQFYAQNLSNGSSASTDIVAYNNLGDGTFNFIDMGIASSNYTEAAYPIFTPGSGYVYNDGGELIIGTGTAAKDVLLFAGGVAATDWAARISGTNQSILTKAGLTVGGALAVTGAASFSSTVALSANPTTALQAATKQYVDNQVTAGIHIHEPVLVTTTGNLTATYTGGGTNANIIQIANGTDITFFTVTPAVGNQFYIGSSSNGLIANTAYFVVNIVSGSTIQASLTFGGAIVTGLTNGSPTIPSVINSGVGATLTNSGAQAALSIDGVALSTTNRVLVRLQTNGAENGVYTVTTVGSGATNWVLTRSTDSDRVNPSDPLGVGTGDYFFVQSGTTGTGDSFVLTTEPNTMIIGYTPLVYTQFSGAITYTGGTNIDVTGQVISVTGAIGATNGGTGQSTVTTGNLLYGSGTNTWGKLAKGAAYKSLIMDASATNVEWNAVALNQSAAVSGALGATNGGTGQSSYTLGDTLYSSAANTLAKLAGNTTTTKKFLVQTGTGSVSAVPAWDVVNGADVNGNITGSAGSVANALTAGTYLTSAGTFNGAAARTFAVDATDANTASKVVARDASGNFSAGTITATLSGAATSATTATNVAGGAANRIPYNTAAGTTSFIVAPTVASTFLSWNGSAFAYSAISTPSSVTFNNGGTGDASGTTFNGSVARTISYNTVGAPSTGGTGATGTWGISISGNAATATSATSATTATNLAGGSAGTIPYQSAAGTTVQLAAGTSTYLLQSNGAAAPSWVAPVAAANNGALTMAVSGTGLSGSASFTANQAGASSFTVTSNATSANTASTIVARDASGNFTAGTITAALSGNASTATSATSATSATTATNLAGGSAGTVPYQSAAGTTVQLAAGTSGQVLRSNGAAAPSWVTATNANTASAIVQRDASGNFSAGTITAALSGNASTATSATTAGTITSQANSATITASTAATANQIVLRDVNGYAYAVYYNSTGTFPVTASANASGMATFTGTNGSDNFGRGYTTAAAAALLSGQTMNINGSSTSCSGNAATATTATTANATATGNNFQMNSLGVGTAGSGTAGQIRATNSVVAFYSSDIKFKENIQNIPNAAITAAAIGGKLFDWTDEYVASEGGEDGYFVQKADFGVIAQDVQKNFPRAVRTRPDGSLAVDYEKLSALALAAVAEHEDRIAKLEALVAKLIEG
jgi:hypothetical protein